jgi:hypothetical protein
VNHVSNADNQSFAAQTASGHIAPSSYRSISGGESGGASHIEWHDAVNQRSPTPPTPDRHKPRRGAFRTAEPSAGPGRPADGFAPPVPLSRTMLEESSMPTAVADQTAVTTACECHRWLPPAAALAVGLARQHG